MFNPGVVIPATKDRLDNLDIVLESLSHSIVRPNDVVVICDGWDIDDSKEINNFYYKYIEKFKRIIFVQIPKHEPGKEQPRNVGVKFLSPETNYVWFLDCDCRVLPETLLEFEKAYNDSDEDRIMYGPYEWLGPESNEPNIDLQNDPRWDMFSRFSPKDTFKQHLGVALGCFSGNLVWPVEEFKRVGGFWNELHMGRCEDGELGIRAAAMGVPMAVVPNARAFHMYHDVDLQKIHIKNDRDVPMINKRHPYVEDKGLVVVDLDGKRFDQVCEICGEQTNTNLYWQHAETCNPQELYGK